MTGEHPRMRGHGRILGHPLGKQASNGSGAHHRMLNRTAVGITTIGVLIGASACGVHPTKKDAPPPSVQTEVRGVGINVNIGSGSQELFVRNLVIISRAHGHGFLSGSIDSAAKDSLQKVSGSVITDSTQPNKPIKVQMSGSVPVGGNKLVKLENHTAIRLSSPAIHPGLAANLRLTFQHAGSQQAAVPIVDGQDPNYQTVRPKAA